MVMMTEFNGEDKEDESEGEGGSTRGRRRR